MRCTRDNTPTDAKANVRGQHFRRTFSHGLNICIQPLLHICLNLTHLDLYHYPVPKCKTRIKDAGRRLRQVHCTKAEQTASQSTSATNMDSSSVTIHDPMCESNSSRRCPSLPFEAMGASICTAIVIQQRKVVYDQRRILRS